MCKIKARELIGAVLAAAFPFMLLLLSTSALAGTGQIFSPSGLPQSSTQNYTAPTPDNTPTVTFPTPPLPLGESVLQSFPGSTLPLDNTNKGTSSGNTKVDVLPSSQSVGADDINSFFQCEPLPLKKSMTQQTPIKANTQNKPFNQKKMSPFSIAEKAIWHTLDNIGVPMVVGHDNDLDPSLRQPYVMPSPTMPSRISPPVAPKKIPESELEGTDVSPGNDK